MNLMAENTLELARITKKRGLHWFVEIIEGVLRMTPFSVGICILFYIISQTALLAALILPWRLVILLSTNQVSGLLPAFMRTDSFWGEVFILSSGAIIALLVYGLGEAGIHFIGFSGARRIQKAHQKTGLFVGHDRDAESYYRRILRFIAAAACCILISFSLALYFPLLLFSLLSYFGVGGFMVLYLKRAAPVALRSPAASDIMTTAWWGIGFLYAIAWMIIAHAAGMSIPSSGAAFVGLLMMRQALSFSSQMYRSYGVLRDQRNKVAALLLSETPWFPAINQENLFNDVLKPDKCDQWVHDLLVKHGCDKDIEFEVQYRPVDGGKTAYINASMIGKSAPRQFFVKLQHRSQQVLAHHEKEILQVARDDWPVPSFIGDDIINGHACFIFEWSDRAKWMSAGERASRLPAIRTQLMSCQMTPALIARYDRSHPHLAKRLQRVDWELLATIAPDHVRPLCRDLRENWNNVLRLIEGMPRQLVLPNLDHRKMALIDGERPWICNWSRWRLEPLGAGLQPEAPDQFENAIATAASVRHELQGLRPELSILAANLFMLENQWSAQDFSDFFITVNRVHQLYGLLS